MTLNKKPYKLLGFVFLFTCTTFVNLTFANSVETEKISVYTEQGYPLNYTADKTQNGEILGYATQVVKAILEEAKLPYEITIVPWSRAMHSINTQKNTMVYSMNRNESRENKYHWIGKIYAIRTYLWGRTKDNDSFPKTLEDAKNYSIGTLRSGAIYDHLNNTGFKHLKILKSVDQYMPLMQRNRFDLFPFFGFAMAMSARRLDIDPKNFTRLMELEGLKNDLYIAMSKQSDPKIVSKLQRANQRLKADGRIKEIMAPMEHLK